MRALITLCIVLVLSGCATYKPTFPSSAGVESETLHVLPVLYQEEMAVQVIVADSSATSYQYGAIGALLGAIIDSAVNNSRAKKSERKAEVLRAATVDYALGENLQAAIAVEPAGNGWSVQTVDDITAETEIRDVVRSIFEESEVDTVMVLTATYQLTPSVDQVNVAINQQVFPRSRSGPRQKPSPSSSRYISYLSPIHAIVYRPFDDGEKELIKAAIKREYEQSIATQAEDEDALRKALAKELQEIDEATEIPEDIAIAETWTPELLAAYLDEAKSHLRYMLTYDWNERVKPKMDNASLERFESVTQLGGRRKQSGRNIGNIDNNTVYRTAAGSIFSVPTAAE